jgi:hypothetical protein
MMATPAPAAAWESLGESIEVRNDRVHVVLEDLGDKGIRVSAKARDGAIRTLRGGSTAAGEWCVITFEPD